MKKILNKCLRLECNPFKLMLTFCVMFIVGCLLLILVNILPEGRIRKNIENSVGGFEVQGDYPYMGVQEVAYAADNWTEAVLLDIYYTADNTCPIYSAFVATEYRPESSTGVERLTTLVNDENWEGSDRLIARSSYWLGYGR